MAARTSAKQKAYKGMLREVAEENSEFLDAIIRYSDIRSRYEEAASTVSTE